MKVEGSGKPLKGSKAPGVGYLYITLIMFMAIMAGTLLSGGFIPVDPNGPGGPPTLPPYFGQDSIMDEQMIILPSDALAQNPKDNLQLKTFSVNVCGQTSAIDILIDTSGSMADDNKIGKLEEALRAFTGNLSGTSAIAIQTFSAKVDERVPWGLYKDNKRQVQATIDGLDAKGWTRMRDGFNTAKASLADAKSKNKFPGYNYYLLLISDGVPEIPPDKPRTCYIKVDDPRTAPAERCFAKEQDPRVPTNLPADIKSLGVPIYAIGLYSNNTSDVKLRSYLEPLLQEISSQPLSTYYYAFEGNNSPENLKRIFNSIVTKICDVPIGAP